MGEATVRKLLPLYLVVFVGFLGYSLMIAVFTPMILRNDNGMPMRFAGAGRAEQDDVVAGVEEVELAEVLDHLLSDRALEGEVELLERLAGREAGRLDA
jgi:hypothetical protein